MWRRGSIVPLLGATVGVWVCLSPVLASSEELGRGKMIYEGHCEACHGSGGKGDGPMGKVLRPPATDLTSPASKKKTDRELLAIIGNGIPGTAMSSWKTTLSEQEMREVVAYIRSLAH